MPRETIQRSKVLVTVPFDTTGIDPSAAGEGTHQVPLGDKNWPADFADGSTLTGGPQVDVTWVKSDGITEGWVQVSIENKDLQRALVSDPLNRYELNKFIRVLRRARDAAFEADE